VAAAPLAVDCGDTDPHAAALHVTLQVTPLLLLSLLTVAATVVDWPWSIDGFEAVTPNEMAGGGVALLPPQPESARQMAPSKQRHPVNSKGIPLKLDGLALMMTSLFPAILRIALLLGLAPNGISDIS
jgi:hypothetical protein